MLYKRRADYFALILNDFVLLCLFIGDQYFYINNENTQVEFKSHQWFGATVRSQGNNILVRIMPRSWSTSVVELCGPF